MAAAAAARPQQRLAAAAVLLLLAPAVVLAGDDRTLSTVKTECGPSRNGKFGKILADVYAGDAKCADAIKQAMSVAPKDASQCPGGVKANVGSEVWTCMTKSKTAKERWVEFIKSCEVLNVNERTGAGEAEAASDAKPSCFPRFNSLKAFQAYLDGTNPSSAAAALRAAGGLLAAAAAAGAGLLL